ncbi:centrosomal protein of 78 kDa [Ixodes scapularis]
MPVISFPKQRNVVPRNNITERPTFRSLYQELCQNSYLCPRRTLLSRIPDDDVLDLFVDNIRTDDWKPLLQALRSGGSLKVISFKSSFLSDYPEVVADVTRLQLVRNVQRDVRVPHLFTPTNLRDFCSALAEHMKNNASLEVLKLHGFPFSVVHIQEMSSGLHAATSLRQLSFNGCPLGKQCLEALCQGLRGSTGLRVLSLCGCQVDGAGAEPLGSLLRLQGLRRHGDAWKQCLRDRPLLLDGLGGLARLSLNNSPLGDTGVAALVAALGDDVWVRALDLQNCAIGNAGATELLELLTNNIVLEVVDIRRNPDIDASLAAAISQKIEANRSERKCEFHLLPLDKSSVVRGEQLHVRSRSTGRLEEVRRPKGKAKCRWSSLDRGTRKEGGRGVRSPSPNPAVGRTRAWLQGKGTPPAKQSRAHKSGLEEELHICQENLKKEQALRQQAQDKLLELFEENRQLRAGHKWNQPGCTVIETSLLNYIENTFTRLLQFLKVMNKKSPFLDDVHPKKPERSENGNKVIRRETKTLLEGNPSMRSANQDSQARVLAEPENGSVPSAVTSASKSYAPLNPHLFQSFIASRAEKIISDIKSRQGSISDRSATGTSSVVEKQSRKYHKGTSYAADPSKFAPSYVENRSTTNASGGQSLQDTSSKHLAEILGMGNIPSKLHPSPTGSPVFSLLESEAASSQYKSDFLPSSSRVSTLSKSDEKDRLASRHGSSTSLQGLTSRHPASKEHHNTEASAKSSSKNSKSSQGTSVASSIYEEVTSEDSILSSSKDRSARSKFPKDTGTKENSGMTPVQREGPPSMTPSVSLSHQPSKSFDVNTADITVSSIYSSTSKHQEKPKGPNKSSSLRHSTPTFAGDLHHQTAPTPSGLSLSQIPSELSTPSTPDTLTSPQLAGSDFDGF